MKNLTLGTVPNVIIGDIVASELYGYMGKVLMVDLSSHNVSEYPWSNEERRLFIGGKMMAAKILLDSLDPDTKPFSPENILVVATGPFTGTGCPSTARFDISSKSPLTNLLASSNCGGNFGYYLKKAGYDALIVKGKAQNPTWIEINEDKINFHSASDLWGLKTSEVQNRLDDILTKKTKQAPKTGKIVIGPAGENLVSYAAICSNERFAGRGGLGAVMGSKNLKAITATGNKRTNVWNKEKLQKLNKKWVKYLKNHPMCGEKLPKYGTAGFLRDIQENSQLATKNYKYGQFDAFEKVSGECLAENYNIGNKGCLTCPIRCARTVEVDGKKVKGPELETLGLLSAGILNDDIEAVFKWNLELDELGMDTISAANTISFAMEANEEGIWDNGLNFGRQDTQQISNLFEDIAFRRGIGNELANGAKWCSEKYGGQNFAAHSKGMELAAYEPRRSVGLGLGYAVSNRGACHLNGGYLILIEGIALTANQQSWHAKADFTAFLQNVMDFVSSLGQCLFTTYGFLPGFLIKDKRKWYSRLISKSVIFLGPFLRFMNKFPGSIVFNLPVVFNQSKTYKYITGEKSSFGKCLKTGKRAYNLERYVNLKWGLNPKDDKLPSRLVKVCQDPNNPKTKVPLDKLIKIYYKSRGWDTNGIPKAKLLKSLKIIK